MMARPITGEQLSSWRAEAEALDALVERGNDRRARMAVMDVSVVLALLDEIDRLKEAFVPRPLQNSEGVGSIPHERLSQWRSDAERWQEDPLDPRADVWTACARLLAAIDELERRRSASAAR